MQQAYTAASTSTGQQPASALGEVAQALAACCGSLVYAVTKAMLVIWHLKGKDPSAALTATVCRKDKLVALCHQSASVLQWCEEQSGRVVNDT